MEKQVKQFFNFFDLGGDYSRLISACKNNEKVSVLSMGQNEKIAICSNIDAPIVYVASDYVSATKIYSQFECIFKDKVSLFPVYIDNLFYKRAQTTLPNIERIKVLADLASGECRVLVVSADSLCAFLPKKKDLTDNIINIKLHDEIDLEKLKTQLVYLGYSREELIFECGQFALRGDILDIFPTGAKNAFRIEFFGDEVESISVLDENLQAGKVKASEVEVLPFTDLFLSEDEINYAIEKLKKIAQNAQMGKPEQSAFVTSIYEIISRLENHDKNFTLDVILSLFENKCDSIFNYLKENTLIIFDEGKMCYDAIINSSAEIELRHKQMANGGEVFNKKCSGYFSANFVLQKILNFGGIVHQKITNSNRFYNPSQVFSFRSLPVSRYYHNFVELCTDLKNWQFNGFKIFLLAQDEKRANSLTARLEENEIFIEQNKSASIADSKSAVVPIYFSGGFILPDQKIVVISSTDLFAPKKATSRVTANRKDVFSVPKVGDYVVHSFHGIGVCEGVTNLKNNFGSKDYVVVRYRDGDRLYVPIDGLNMLERFSGAETPKKLSKIGGVEFAKVKEKVKASVKKLAFDLTELYAKRQAKKGFAFLPDNALQREFENSFAHIETQDQLKSIEEIKKDMQSQKAMDRLLCGDVGFGKTEVAMRAMFKAVLSNKQVAFVAPTTILSQQHFNTCKARMEPFGVRVEVLNRFKTAKETAKILNDLALGKIDVICGTHRLLSKDVEFLDLGLVVLDEEQKFGVEDKEKLKNKYPLVDFLTLSATPIPRTLQMSLSGIRDVSIINTPPSERLPVQTFVCEYSESLVRDAIIRELARGGQVFILFNRVEKIYAFSEELKKLVPEASILVAHGQLSSRELEDIIYMFYKKEADVLVCTTIIENGIDIENANTLIVCDSERFGLSQLYQIRGRVGRGSKTAFAYFTYKYDKVLSEEAYKRLDAISEFTEFGSGFKVAMRDLEIRGGGNVLGAEQHGFMQKVGYELYNKLLKNAVAEIKGQKVEEEIDVLMRVSIDAFIPENFITNSANRMTMYKNISSISSIEDKISLEQDLSDTFGQIPKPVLNLIDIAYAKSLAKKLKITEIVSTAMGIKLIFKDSISITDNNGVGQALFEFRNSCALELGETSMVKMKPESDGVLNLKNIIKFLEIASKTA